jgi:hypothetical protein
VNQAADDGYDLLHPDVLADAMWSVAQNQIAAGHMDFLQQCDLFVRDYDAHVARIDSLYPRKAGGA